MSNTLSKDILTSVTPGEDAAPPRPARPAYDEVRDYTVNGIIGWERFGVRVDLPGGGYTIGYAFFPIFGKIPVHEVIHHPATPALPAVPGPPVFTRNYQRGWNSGAVSIDPFVGNKQFRFRIDSSVSGVVIGLNDVNTGAGYIEIDWAVYAETNQYRIVEKGVIKTGYFIYTSADIFTWRRVGGEIALFQGDDLIYTSPRRYYGPLFADCSLYSGGDRVYDAVLEDLDVAFAATNGSLTLPLPDVGLFAAEVGNSDLDLALPDVGIALHSEGHNELALALPDVGLEMYAGAHFKLVLALPDGRFSGEAGMFEPAFTDLSLGLLDANFYAIGLAGRVGELTLPLPDVVFKGGDHAFADLDIGLPDVDIYIREDFDNTGTAFLSLSGYSFFASASTDNSIRVGADLRLSGYRFNAYTGAEAALRLSGYTLTATGVSKNAASAALALSGYDFYATALTSNTAAAQLKLSGYRLHGESGAVADLALSGYTFTAAGLVGNIARAALELSGYTFDGTAIRVNYATAELIGPSFVPVEMAVAALRLSGYALVAAATIERVISTEGYSVTFLRQGGIAVTRYTNYPFKQFIRFRGQNYGVRSDGVYALRGDTDAGSRIVADVIFCQDRYRSHNRKRPRTLYFYGEFQSDIAVNMIVDDDVRSDYDYTATQIAPSAHKVTLGKGVRAQWLGFRFRNTAGGPFQMVGIDPEMEVLRGTTWE